VDRIVRVFLFLLGLTPVGKVFGNGSDSGGLGNRHLIEVYFFGVGVIAKGGIKLKLRSDRKEYTSAKLTPLQWIRGKSCPFRLGRVSSGVILEIPISLDVDFWDDSVPKIIFFANVRDHRWLPVARLVPTERSGVSTRRDAGSHSVDRIVRNLLSFYCCGMNKFSNS
jgi:hypothetical protein